MTPSGQTQPPRGMGGLPTRFDHHPRLARDARAYAYLSEVRDRGARRDFGITSVCDCSRERFQFGKRKTRHPTATGRKIKELPELRKAMKEGRVGWKRSVSQLARRQPAERAMWLDSAMSLSVRVRVCRFGVPARYRATRRLVGREPSP